MTVPTDPFLFVNGTNADATQVNARYAPLYAALNGALDTDNLLDVINEQLGLTKGAIKRRGKSIIPTTEARANAAYGTLATPDQVTGIVLPTDGLINVLYHATWQESAGGARAAVFIGANQLRIPNRAAATTAAQAAATNNTVGQQLNIDQPLMSSPAGLVGWPAPASTAYVGDVTTGQIAGGGYSSLGMFMDLDGTVVSIQNGAGGVMSVFAAAGTYTISVQFKAPGGTVTVKNRKLWVWTTGF